MLASILYQNSENNDSETDQKDMPLILPFENNTNTNTNVWGLEFALIYRLEKLTADKTRQKRLLFLQTSLQRVLFFRGRKEFSYRDPLIQ